MMAMIIAAPLPEEIRRGRAVRTGDQRGIPGDLTADAIALDTALIEAYSCLQLAHRLKWAVTRILSTNPNSP
jgi:hypothetical protein